MAYPSYLVHFNKNHSPKNGQFTFGDGDGDGSKDERGRRGRYKPEAIGNNTVNKSTVSDDRQSQSQKKAIKNTLKLTGKLGLWIAGKVLCKKVFGASMKELKSLEKYVMKNTDLKSSIGKDNIKSFNKKKADLEDRVYDKIASVANDKLNEYIGG